MTQKPSFVIPVAIVLGCISLGLLLNQPSSGQQPAPAVQVGRFQAFTGESPGGVQKVFLCDTTTGKCYVHWPEANGGKGAWYTASPPWPTAENAPKQ